MKSFLKTAVCSLLTVSSLSLVITSSFLIHPYGAEARANYVDDILKIGGRLIRRIRIPLPKIGNRPQPYTTQTLYRLPNGQIVKVCQDVYPGSHTSQPYYCN
jgi:hypothetical protein